MGASYSQFCPVAKAMELLDERWTLLVIRELMMGSEHFNQLRRGLPRMSPTLLSRRLQQLVRAGIITREESDDAVHYRLTEAGEELRPVVLARGTWDYELVEPLKPRAQIESCDASTCWTHRFGASRSASGKLVIPLDSISSPVIT